MIKLVEPKTFLVGMTKIHQPGMEAYLHETDQSDFLFELGGAIAMDGISEAEALCSFYAKLCYASLVLGKNENVSKVRTIEKNLLATIESGHGSVFEHCVLNFVVTNCSRVFTHELVRHRVGTAFSQTSGRYVRTDNLTFVYDPILDKAKGRILALLQHIETEYNGIQMDLGMSEVKDFAVKKKMTSALRRTLPNGQANEIGFSVNLRSLRHTIQMRTSRHAEWEIRLVFNQIVEIVRKKHPAIFSDAMHEFVDGQMEWAFKNAKI